MCKRSSLNLRFFFFLFGFSKKSALLFNVPLHLESLLKQPVPLIDIHRIHIVSCEKICQKYGRNFFIESSKLKSNNNVIRRYGEGKEN